MSRKPRHTLIVALMSLSSGVGTQAWPYDNATHQAINDGAAVRSSLNTYLVEVLGFPGGISTTFNGRDVREWMREGGVFEDQPVARAANHFHYPLREWDRALLTDPPGSAFAIQSSVLWAQNPNQDPILGPADTWSWIGARREFREALTRSSRVERDEALANTFRALGQVLHLVADGSVPAHARNDSHVTGEPFETWVEAQARRRRGERAEDAAARFLATFAPTSESFSPTLLRTTPNPLAPIPIAKVFDADAYDGTAGRLGLTGGNAVGITEVSNANLFSGSTIFADRFGVSHQRYSPFPASTAVEQFIDPSNNRRYWRKTSPGVPVEHLATVSRLDFFRRQLGEALPASGGLDPAVHAEYARRLIPRAVGYSTGLLDYFFRGSLDFRVRTAAAGGSDRELTITNTSAEAMAGTFTLYAEDAAETRSAVGSSELPLAPGGTSAPLRFTAPAQATAYVLFFQGRLGEEEGAVAARRRAVGVHRLFLWEVRFYNDQFDTVNLLSQSSIPACGIRFFPSLSFSGTHTGSRQAYLFFALASVPGSLSPPVEVSDLQVTRRLSPVPLHFGVKQYSPFGAFGGALGIIRGEGERTCGDVVLPYAPLVTRVVPSPETRHYLFGGEDGRLHDTGVVASVDGFLTRPLTEVSWEELRQIAQRLHPRLTPPASFPSTADAYAVMHFDIPPVDNWAVSDSNKAAWGIPTPTVVAATVAEMWDLDRLTLQVRDEPEIEIPNGFFSLAPGRLRTHDLQLVYGEEYRRTERGVLQSSTFRYNPNDPFVPLEEPLP